MVWVQSVAMAQVSKLTHRTIIRFPTRFPLWGEVFRRRWSWPAETTCSEANLSQFQKHQKLPFSRFELVIVWKIQIDEEGKVFPKLDLLTKVPERGRTPCLQAPFPEDFSVYPTKPSECLIWVYMGRIKVETVINVLCRSPFEILQSVTTKQHMRGLLSWGLADVWSKAFSLPQKLLVTALFGLLHPVSRAPTVWLLGGKILLDRHYKVSYRVCFLHSPGAGQEQDHRNCSSEFPKPTRSTWNWSRSWQSDKTALCRKWLAPC